jgi:hypothetical protein
LSPASHCTKGLSELPLKAIWKTTRQINFRETIMKLTQHAALRAKERAIPPILVDLLMSYGATEKAGEGAITYYFDKASKRRFRVHTLGRLPTSLKNT